jgi:hypothetical protein
MTLKVLSLTALALALTSGVALADRDRGDHRGRDRHGSVREHRGNWDRGDRHRSRVVIRDRDHWRGGSRVIVRNEPRYRHHNHVVRRPIYVSRPVIRHRYYNYYQRPAVIFENYNAMPGYYWVPGRWDWSGYEWIWQPGHYEPDVNYVDPAYGYSY